MDNCFPLDFIRQIIEQTLLEEHNANPTKYFGGSNQVNLFSFYEQLQKDSEVDRYVEIYQDLVDQQNRSGLIMNGTIIAPENPTITNLYLDTIIPMSFTCSFRVMLGDRDKAITTINNLIEKLKGRKQDVALFENGQIFKVGTIGNNGDKYAGLYPKLKNGDYIGTFPPAGQLINTFVTNQIASYTALGIADQTTYPQWYYFRFASGNKMGVVYKFNATSEWVNIPTTTTLPNDDVIVESQDNYPDIIFPPLDVSFEQYKVSMSFDSIRCDEPRNLNAKEYCTISFGGSATLVNNGVALGNDLVKLGISKSKIIASPNIVIHNTSSLLEYATWLEPLEMPSGNSANTITNLLNSNRFNTNSHTTNITIANQYSFVVDRSIPLLDQLYKYARWGYFGVDNSGETPSYTNAITPNMIFRVYEMNSSWGQVEINYIDAKIVEDISIENTESDTLSMTLTLQKQGGEDISGSGGGGGDGSSTDYVTTDTEQTITAKKTFTNQVVFTNTLSNGTYVYTMPSESGQLATHEWVQNYTGNLSGYAKLGVPNTFSAFQTFNEGVRIGNNLGAINSIEFFNQETQSYESINGGTDGGDFEFLSASNNFGVGGKLYVKEGIDIGSYENAITYYDENDYNITLSLPTGGGTIATQTWVGNQGFYKSSTDLIPTTDGTLNIGSASYTFDKLYITTIQFDNGNLVLEEDSGNLIIDNGQTLETIATQSWVSDQGYLTSSSLSGYATQSWVQNQGYITSYTNYYLTSGSWNGMTYTFTSNGGNPSVSFTLPSVMSLSNLSVVELTGVQVLLPDIDDEYYIGSADYPWAGIYVDTILFDNGDRPLYQDNGVLYFGNTPIATETFVKNALTPTQIGTYDTTRTIQTASGNYNGFQFNVGTTDNNGLYVFTYGNNMILLPCYGLQAGTEYKIPATLIDSSNGYNVYVLTYRLTSAGYLQIYNKGNVIPSGYNAFLFKVKLY